MKGQVWHCIKFPNRSVRVVGKFTNTLMHVRPFGLLVQGITDGQDYGSPYEITEEDLKENFNRSQKMAWLRRLLSIQLHVEFWLE